jgi:hypothetical protein
VLRRRQRSSRNAAGLAIKNALTAREAARQEEYASRWKGLDPAAGEFEKLTDEAGPHAGGELDGGDRSDDLTRDVVGYICEGIVSRAAPPDVYLGVHPR